MIRLTLIISLILIFNGCSTKHLRQHSKPQEEIQNITSKPKAIPSYKPKNKNWITTALYNEYKKWYKTPHKLGGINTNGLDCSSLIQIVYRDAFSISLPRTTKDQVKQGYLISRNSTKEGDLVFFKTGFNKRHAGIIIEEDKFMHTSKKYGVSISSMSNPYWKSRYWQSRRVLP
ncbi:lipoprotein containing NLP/P60 domain [Sulfurimonas gotlandica GD1]|jgi:cell wall-associated NlpC family hydrolase|uniref:Lipoprotein containing NLP/P60 domain n=1 Tax=Sulfurimonas gotlandica (strain DSM 19862 / JCM 16533 / GD1) TaxID=929558 RepID=B6BM35_SULGG|nr:NlpC/P60 family protein [Sulfurimonas gotlandica]EDZ61791.1 NLP/P60 protein [Sulfurimonas gotlandica GD1]EHP29389.1 lipoprotein containing NLP/P60 domain [Sulfurimonas gotlandica GD1]